MLFEQSNFDRQGIINNTVAFGKPQGCSMLPVVLTTVESEVLQREYVAAVASRIPGAGTHRAFVHELLGRQKTLSPRSKKADARRFLIAGLWTEVCVAFPTVQAIHDGYEVYVVEDCCGDVSQLAHDNAMKRVIQAGASRSPHCRSCSNAARLGNKGTYDAVMDIVKNHYGAYGSASSTRTRCPRRAGHEISRVCSPRCRRSSQVKPDGRSLLRPSHPFGLTRNGDCRVC